MWLTMCFTRFRAKQVFIRLKPILSHRKKDIKLLFGISLTPILYTAATSYKVVHCRSISDIQQISITKYTAKKEFVWLLLTCISGIVIAIINIIIPLYFGKLITIITQPIHDNVKQYLSNILNPVNSLILIYLSQAIATFYHIYSLTFFGENISNFLRVWLYSSLITEELSFYDKHKLGDLITRLTNDIQEYKSSFKKVISIGVKSSIQCVGTLYTLYTLSPEMTWGVFIVLPTLVGIGSLLASGLRKLSFACKEKLSLMSCRAAETLGNVRFIKSFASEDCEIDKFVQLSNEYENAGISLGWGIATFQSLSHFTLNALTMLTVAYGGSLLIPQVITGISNNATNTVMTPGTLMAFLMGVQNIQKCLAQLSTLINHYAKMSVSGKHIQEYLNYDILEQSNVVSPYWFDWKKFLHRYIDILCMEPQYLYGKDLFLSHIPSSRLLHGPTEIGKLIISPEKFTGTIKFENVTFAYPTKPDINVLENFNLTITPGQTVAICGHNGSGKTTLVSLLEGFYNVTAGRITIDGIDIKDLNKNWLRTHIIGVIDQDPVIFSGSLMENVTYGSPKPPPDKLEKVLTMTKIDEILNLHNSENIAINPNFNDSLKTHKNDLCLSERGRNLSGGQKQRINIARTLLKDTPIVILDEATSSMDPPSEYVIKKALMQYLPGRTVIMIAHRLHTITQADSIIVLSKGQIVEKGTHEELCRKKGLYWDMLKNLDLMIHNLQ